MRLRSRPLLKYLVSEQNGKECQPIEPLKSNFFKLTTDCVDSWLPLLSLSKTQKVAKNNGQGYFEFSRLFISGASMSATPHIPPSCNTTVGDTGDTGNWASLSDTSARLVQWLCNGMTSAPKHQQNKPWNKNHEGSHHVVDTTPRSDQWPKARAETALIWIPTGGANVEEQHPISARRLGREVASHKQAFHVVVS